MSFHLLLQVKLPIDDSAEHVLTKINNFARVNHESLILVVLSHGDFKDNVLLRERYFAVDDLRVMLSGAQYQINVSKQPLMCRKYPS